MTKSPSDGKKREALLQARKDMKDHKSSNPIDDMSPGEVFKLSEWSPIRKENGLTQVTVGYPSRGQLVYDEMVRYDGQDGAQWDQLISEKEVEKVSGESDRMGGSDSVLPCEPNGFSWWMTCRVEFGSTVRTKPFADRLKDISIYICWYQLVHQTVWGHDNTEYFDSWPMSGQQLALDNVGNRMDAMKSMWGKMSDGKKSRHRSANDTEDTPVRRSAYLG